MSNSSASGASGKPEDLVISRLLRVSRAALWRAWTEPALLKEWFCPRPWTTEVLDFDLRPGGAFHTLMRGPGGETSDNPGVFLEIVPQRKLAFTSLMTQDWRPATPWLPFTAIITMGDEGDDGTHYVATAMHPDEATKKRHEDMGFFEGWNLCIDQLEAFASQLR